MSRISQWDPAAPHRPSWFSSSRPTCASIVAHKGQRSGGSCTHTQASHTVPGPHLVRANTTHQGRAVEELGCQCRHRWRDHEVGAAVGVVRLVTGEPAGGRQLGDGGVGSHVGKGGRCLTCGKGTYDERGRRSHSQPMRCRAYSATILTMVWCRRSLICCITPMMANNVSMVPGDLTRSTR